MDIDLNKVVWTTKDGRKIPVKELPDRHLNNIIKMLERSIETGQDLLASMFSYISEDAHEMASYEVEGQIEVLMDTMLNRGIWIRVLKDLQEKRKKTKLYLDPPS